MEHLGIELKGYYSAEGDYAQNRPTKKRRESEEFACPNPSSARNRAEDGHLQVQVLGAIGSEKTAGSSLR